MLELGFKVFLSYLAGSLNGALLIGWLSGGIDIRKSGSGNAGGTNALRTQGKLFAFFVMVVDIGKGVLPVMILPPLNIAFVGEGSAVSGEWLTYACGAAAIFGHCYPVWFGFNGGKGAATTLGVLLTILPGLFLPAVIVWFGILFVFGYVGLATIMAALAVPVFLLMTAGADQLNLIVFTSIVACFIVYTHRSNLRKLAAGEGSPDIRFSLFGRSHHI
ncbi:MAG: glycerol-3-phosphate 1-O-acyltransferase PlsY [Gammaproteobacteria bacterium]|nr:glycerol-3-phosphate 1-O-acyltransferase PlsY [Gammaproteobacteria bacterium]MCP4089107.1 glycerol-3-phosphate 1-O-acyltransferase PlsY [Gammaproteobacteria bacterium]MCP4276868.1 glycerol-3-phosphate 1-O-acyltransferase PlsY [Gammaproteobacteria bacterium]MCP4928865.1 glycerol-3-phosphate 1-O-acyltransferase PlsY [Gammaproteobacteria bacterium]